MRVYNLIDIISGKVPFEKKMFSSRGFVVKTPIEIEKFDFVKRYFNNLCSICVGNLKLYYFRVLEGPTDLIAGYYRYRLKMYYELLPSSL